MMYALRDVPEDLWERVKARATREGHRLREVMLQLLEYYAAAGLPESPRETAKGLDLAAAGDAKAIRDYPKRIRPDWELQAAWWVGYIRGSSDTVAVRAELKEAFERIARGDHLQNHS